MLGSDSQEKRLAAALVLGELKARAPNVVKALGDCLAEDGAPLQRRCLEALAAVGARKAVPQILPLLGARDAGVRAAAIDALASVGEEVVPLLDTKATGVTLEHRRALDEVLARVGGKEAFTALIASLDGADESAASAAAIAMRARVKDADGNQRRSYLAQLEQVLARQKKRAPAEQSHAAIKAALKMLGYLEDARAAEPLLDFTGPKFPASLRQEALIALRFTFKAERPDAKIVNALVAAASDTDRALAQAALITLAGIPLPARAAERLEPLLAHPDLERARFVIDMLAHRQTEEAVDQLVAIVGTLELRRADLAARALVGRREACGALAEVLVATDDVQRARLVARVFDGMADALKPAQRRKLLDSAMTQLEASKTTWQPLFDVAHAADPIAAGNALRDLRTKLARRKPDLALQVLAHLCRTDQATREDRFALALALLAASALETSAAARHADESLGILSRLSRERFDVVGALLGAKNLELEALFYVGFHFLEERNDAGEDLLRAVVERAGRKKLGTMAKNKLALAERRGVTSS